ncbi:MAG: DUF1735 domain-containing protein [Bacteroidota bacterium]
MKNKIIVIITFLAGLVLLNSCLKDDADYWKDDVKGKMYATVLTPTLQALSLSPTTDTVPFSFMVNIATDNPPSSSVTLTLAVDTNAVHAYNARKNTAYKPFPTVELTTPTVTVAAGTRTAMVHGKVWGADKLNACDNFIAAITIKKVSDGNITIAENMKSYLLSLPISNPYAGDYDVVGYRIRPGNPTEPIAPGQIEALNTVDCKTVRKNGFGNYFSFDVVIEITTDPVVVDGANCFKVIATPIDPATGASVGGMWATWTGDPTLTPPNLEINYYNPATQTFVLNCFYVSAAGNRIMYEVLTRK